MRLLSLRPDNLLITPKVTLSISFRNLVTLLPAIQATGLLAITLEGLTPSEHTSLLDTQPDMSLSAHPAPIIQSLGKYQFANARTTLVHVWQSCRASI